MTGAVTAAAVATDSGGRDGTAVGGTLAKKLKLLKPTRVALDGGVLRVAAACFEGLPAEKRLKLVTAVLKADAAYFDQIEALTPDEDQGS